MAVKCTTEDCSENGIESDTAELEAFYGYPGFDVYCGQCGHLCAWPDGTPPSPEPEPEAE